jgi:hypothetical protein
MAIPFPSSARRIAVLLVILAGCIVGATTRISRASASVSSPLLNGVYMVTINGGLSLYGMLPSGPVLRTGVLVVLPAAPGSPNPVEMCLFAGEPLSLNLPGSGSGATWLATNLECGSRSAISGLPTGPFTSGLNMQSASVLTSADLSIVAAVPITTGAVPDYAQAVFENIFTSESYASTAWRITGGWWGATTPDGGRTVRGQIHIQGTKGDGVPMMYDATFSGSLLGRLQPSTAASAASPGTASRATGATTQATETPGIAQQVADLAGKAKGAGKR